MKSDGCDRPSARTLDRGFHDVSDPDQVVSGGSEGEHPTHPLPAAMLGSPQAGGGHSPTKDLFDKFAFSLALAIAFVAGGAFINAARTTRYSLRHMRRHGLLPQAAHEIESVVTFVGCQRDPFVATR